jgi:MOSC domain-containing protein YiiM
MTGRLIAVCAAGTLRPDIRKDNVTGIDKRPLTGPVWIGPLGVDGDRQVDAGHGGTEQAVYAYAREEAERWASELGRDVPPGTFGENLATLAMPVTDAVIGEQWLIGGDPDTGALLEVSAPRTPCPTFQAWMDQPRWVKRFTARGDVGVYLRVLQPGTVQADDPIEVLHRPAHGITVREVFQVLNGMHPDPERVGALLDAGGRLHPRMVTGIRKALDRLAQRR